MIPICADSAEQVVQGHFGRYNYIWRMTFVWRTRASFEGLKFKFTIPISLHDTLLLDSIKCHSKGKDKAILKGPKPYE